MIYMTNDSPQYERISDTSKTLKHDYKY